jgi:hypothetical protein
MRKIRRHIRLALLVLFASAAVVSAGEQTGAAKAGEEVIVTQSSSGQELRGRMLELSPTSLAMLVNGQRVDVPIDNVLRIDVRNDSLKNGAIIGGAVMGTLTALTCLPFAESAGQCATALVFNTGFGVLLGAGIDALHKGRTPIYIKAGKSESSLQVKIRF